MAQKTFFITGATGLLGTEVVAQLLASTDDNLRILVRAASQDEAVSRLKALWWDDDILAESIGRRVHPVVGDITKEHLDLDGAQLADVTHVIHCAAETGLQKSRDELWGINVDGTRHMVGLAKRMPLLERFTYISTAYVAGTQSGIIKEEAIQGTSFYSLYEESKAEAEGIVRSSGLPLTICRPGMIVGNSKSGRTRNFNTVYYVLKLMLTGKLRVLPVSRRQVVNVVPVDYVARQVVALTTHPHAAGKTFHLVASREDQPQVGQLVDSVRAWAKVNLHTDIPQPFCVPIPFLRVVGKRYNAGQNAKRRNLLSNLTALMPYFLDNHTFDRTNTDQVTGTYSMSWRGFLPALLSFACRHNFMRLSDKSIFRQALERRESRHYPINYYNITANGTERMTGHEMNRLVLCHAEQLRLMGVQAGDKVAIAGINCIDHAAIDNAIGLVGAVSVPIYYTTPANEIALLLSKSGARCFFVGDERISQNLNQVPATVRIIPFGPLSDSTLSAQPTVLRSDLTASNMKDTPFCTPNSHVATIRYTSGTTGEPKGVMFNFNQLKWMSEVLTNLLPWRERNSQMRYLSFLPMSHVVEGILAAYAPYCMLCRADIYYLNDFQMLTKALPLVRPTVFFSVPRFYEKLWEQIEQNPLGRRYLSMADGWKKRLYGQMLRRAVLRKAGLDQCSQLLVGSAPISKELLFKFRQLGIEIYNAYGQTEAPLVTLNPLGGNVIPSIGTPLPDTSVATAPDGELLVRGPQVAMGYYGLDSGTFQNGVLHTGDLGRIDDDGYVYIKGRKKDMLITSYGKNINCTKIEQRLCDIGCVVQAVLVGDGRPYCTALLWTEGSTDYLQTDIERMNRQLSHPEQVKRWRIVETPLSIGSGELTPNLKVKRQAVLAHYKSKIDDMYGNNER